MRKSKKQSVWWKLLWTRAIVTIGFILMMNSKIYRAFSLKIPSILSNWPKDKVEGSKNLSLGLFLGVLQTKTKADRRQMSKMWADLKVWWRWATRKRRKSIIRRRKRWLKKYSHCWESCTRKHSIHSGRLVMKTLCRLKIDRNLNTYVTWCE